MLPIIKNEKFGTFSSYGQLSSKLSGLPPGATYSVREGRASPVWNNTLHPILGSSLPGFVAVQFFRICEGFRTPAPQEPIHTHGGRRPKTSNGRNRESGRRIGSAGPAMGISPRAQALMWWNELAAHSILPRSMCVNWVVNEPRNGCVTQYCAFEFLQTTTLT